MKTQHKEKSVPFQEKSCHILGMKKLLWIDLEMTGLDVEIERIIEVGAIVTDMDLKPLDTYHCVVRQPQAFIDNMDEWNTTHHTESGLVAQIPGGKPPEEAEKDLCDLIDKHFPDPKDRPILCGNSIFQDRKFIDKYMRELANKLHYRMLDVTSWKIIMNEVYKVEYQKQDAHRALDDIRESIAELGHFMKHVSSNFKP